MESSRTNRWIHSPQTHTTSALHTFLAETSGIRGALPQALPVAVDCAASDELKSMAAATSGYSETRTHRGRLSADNQASALLSSLLNGGVRSPMHKAISAWRSQWDGDSALANASECLHSFHQKQLTRLKYFLLLKPMAFRSQLRIFKTKPCPWHAKRIRPTVKGA